MRLLLVWLVNALALLALPYVFPWVKVDTFGAALIAALVLNLINTLIRPLLILLTLPVTLLTLGLFIFVINGLLSGGSARSWTASTSAASGPVYSARSSTA
jgi:putative membrane protein